MKNVCYGPLVVFITFIMYSCSRTNTESASLVGNWKVVNDSSLNTNKIFTLSAGLGGIGSSNYLAQPCGATFNFNSNGNLATSFFDCSYAFPTVDSATYTVTGNQVTISIFAQNGGCCSFVYFNPVFTRTYTTTRLAANRATLFFSTALSASQEPAKTETINLSK